MPICHLWLIRHEYRLFLEGEEKMIYIYDILLNWTDMDLQYDFYEWNKKDMIEHIKKIPLKKVSKEDYHEMISHEITCSKEELESLCNKTEVFRNGRIESIPYAFLITNGVEVMALELNSKGTSLYRSKLLLDEEDDVVGLSDRISISAFDYQVGRALKKQELLTRKETYKRNYLAKEITASYRKSEKKKLEFFYQEYFQKPESDMKKIYHALLNSLKNYNDRHDALYDLLQLPRRQKNSTKKVS